MSVRVIELSDLTRARAELLAIGADPAGVKLMAPKAVSRAVKLTGLRPPAANIIKQEMLSFGGDAATAYGSIDHSVEATDLMILGTVRQLEQLLLKLRSHQFGLPQVAEQIAAALLNYERTPPPLSLGSRSWDFSERTYLMGILNVTPDSFSDGGKFVSADAAVEQGKKLLAGGADIIDVGGESTRPGSAPVPAEEEQKRVLPVIERLSRESGALISIDTTKAEVAKAALKAGAVMVNDISGLRFDPRMAEVVAEYKAALCLMHIQGTPRDMQEKPAYIDLMGEILDYLNEGLAIANSAGILLEKIMVDPGIGFGKSVGHNLEILARLRELKALGRPLLVGPSRKSFLGRSLGLPVEARLEGTAAAVSAAVMNGADIVRVHDAAEMSRIIKISDAIVRLR